MRENEARARTARIEARTARVCSSIDSAYLPTLRRRQVEVEAAIRRLKSLLRNNQDYLMRIQQEILNEEERRKGEEER